MSGPFHGQEKFQRNYKGSQNYKELYMKLQIKVINIEAEVSDE